MVSICRIRRETDAKKYRDREMSVMRGYTMRHLTVWSTCIAIIAVVHRPHNVSAVSDLTRRSAADSQAADGESMDRPPPPAYQDLEDALWDQDGVEEKLEDTGGMLMSGCVEYDSGGDDRFYIRELIEDVDGDHVIVTTHYGQLRGIRISGIPAAGKDKTYCNCAPPVFMSSVFSTPCVLST